MLNISQNKIDQDVSLKSYKAYSKVLERKHYKYFNRFLLVFAIFGCVTLFLPWTQNISGSGFVTTLKPDQRPQTIQSPIPGKIEKWFIKEGDFVKKGDTILNISEVKNEYFDPKLLERTDTQIKAKYNAVLSYQEKAKALDVQIQALRQERNLKLEQAQNKLKQSNLKVKSDSIDLKAAITNQNIAKKQYDRTLQLQKEGLKAVVDVETKKLKLQETAAKFISQENKLLTSKNAVINAQIELRRIRAAYADKVAKAQSDKFTAQSKQFDAEVQVSKLENQNANYEIRTGLYFILAPQSGYINKTLQSGLGETFKAGDQLVSIMPSNYQLAVETFVRPIDLPLIHLGENVRIQFDGWPAIIFSGWPNISYGTYGGEVVAIENFISANGKFRVLIAPDPNDHDWPKAIRIGSGANSMALLEDVPIWFELWRNLNGFPPNYYKPAQNALQHTKKKG